MEDVAVARGMGAVHSQPIVIIDDDKAIRKTLQLHFEPQGMQVITANFAKEGLEKLEQLDSAIVILDLRLPDTDGVEILKELGKTGKNYYSIIITAYPDMESTVKAVQCGVGEYIHKPIDIQELDNAVAKAQDFFSSLKANDESLVPVPPLDSADTVFVGKGPLMKEVFKMVGMVSMSKSPVLITGESGTGKELVAKAIHLSSKNASSPFISINCSAIVDTLLESELFGHVKGAFTGAINAKEGKFAQAGDGTIFLDEISEMSFGLQAKILRVLQEREFEQVGGKTKIKANCRILYATNKNLEQMVREGKFRDDLYYRIKVINIHIPPLRERVEDIPLLALYFIAKKGLETDRGIKHVSRESLNWLMNQQWPGNVRQLENAITHTVIMSRGDRLFLKHFMAAHNEKSGGDDLAAEANIDTSVFTSKDGYRPVSLNEIEKEQIAKTLNHTKWHKGETCRILGITRPRLDRKIKKYGIISLHQYLQDD